MKVVNMHKVTIILSLFIFFVLASFSLASAKSHSPGVNKFAWLASLQTIKFMPLSSADPYSGVIITDWYSIDPSVRYKVDVYVLDGILNGRSVQVSVFKQVKEKDKWVDVQLSNEIANKIEESILNQASILRANSHH